MSTMLVRTEPRERASDLVREIRRQHLRTFKKTRNWREDVASVLGVSPGTVGAWRVRTQRPNAANQAKLKLLKLAISGAFGPAERGQTKG